MSTRRWRRCGCGGSGGHVADIRRSWHRFVCNGAAARCNRRLPASSTRLHHPNSQTLNFHSKQQGTLRRSLCVIAEYCRLLPSLQEKGRPEGRPFSIAKKSRYQARRRIAATPNSAAPTSSSVEGSGTVPPRAPPRARKLDQWPLPKVSNCRPESTSVANPSGAK